MSVLIHVLPVITLTHSNAFRAIVIVLPAIILLRKINNYFNRNCTSCDPGKYLSESQCFLCDSKCLTCQNDFINCTACLNGFVLLNNSCIELCPSGYYMNGTTC